MFEQTAIKNSIYRIDLTGKVDKVVCIICKASLPIDFRLDKKKRKLMIKEFEKAHIEKCRKGT